MKLSFIIPSHNCAVWLPHAVSSCLEQTHRDIEVVVMDDGSTDRTQEYLTWLAKNEPRACVMRSEKNIGRSSARNMGNQKAQGDIICVLDADDISTPNRAELTVRKFNNSKADFIYGSATVIDCLGRPSYVLAPDTFNRDRALKEMQNRIVHSTLAYRREMASKFPYRTGDIAKLGIDDWAFQIEALIGGAAFDFVPQKLACYRLLSTQITKTRDEAAVLEAKKAFLEKLLAGVAA